MSDEDDPLESPTAPTSAGSHQSGGGEKVSPKPTQRDPWRTFDFKSGGGLEVHISYSAKPEEDEKDPADRDAE